MAQRVCAYIKYGPRFARYPLRGALTGKEKFARPIILIALKALPLHKEIVHAKTEQIRVYYVVFCRPRETLAAPPRRSPNTSESRTINWVAASVTGRIPKVSLDRDIIPSMQSRKSASKPTKSQRQCVNSTFPCLCVFASIHCSLKRSPLGNILKHLNAGSDSCRIYCCFNVFCMNAQRRCMRDT